MIDGLSLEDWNKLWDAIVRTTGHEVVVDNLTIPPGEVRIQVVSFIRKARNKIVADLRELAARHPEQRAWTESLALRYAKEDDVDRG
jgi:hypothetical protein